MNLIQSIVIAMVEGLTEFLPISSTGHMVITSSLFGIEKEAFTKLFEVSIQLGAIMAVVVLYWKRFVNLTNYRFYVKLLIAVIPSLIFGKLLDDRIDAALGNPIFISCMFIGGGIFLLFVDRIFSQSEPTTNDELSIPKAFRIGLFQVLAIALPGISRSAATIIGGMTQKLSRHAAAEFSFFLAVPTMAAATGYSLILKDWNFQGIEQKGYTLILQNGDYLQLFVIGNLIAFVVALIAIKFFIGFLQKHGFRLFGVYRIIAGLLFLGLTFAGIIHD